MDIRNILKATVAFTVVFMVADVFAIGCKNNTRFGEYEENYEF